MRKLAFGAVCVLFMQLFGLPFLTTGHMGIEAAHAQYFKGEPFQAYPRPMDAPFASWQEADGATTSLLRYKGDVLLVNFWATWCGPCKAIAPVIDEIAGEYNGKVKVGKVDVDQNQDTAMKFGVRSIPTLLIMKDGKVVNQIVGAVPKGNITTMLDEII